MTDLNPLTDIRLHFSKLPHGKLRQARAWAIGCILLLMCTESMIGYVLGCFYTDNSGFNQAYRNGNTRLAKMHRSVKIQVASLMDFGRTPSKKTGSQVPFTISFNLFIDQYKAQLPRCTVSETEVNSGFHYNLLYDFTHSKDILHPPRWT